jgi:predicted metalloprotease with PDZ domain
MGNVPEGENKKIAWFHEGFTQYYAFLLVFRAGLMALPKYVESINRDLRDYPASVNPYIRGRVIALWLDGEIRKESNGKSSLDNVMFDMVHDADRPLTEARIVETIDGYLATGARDSLQYVLNGGALPELDNYPVGPCVTVSVDQVPTFDLGFDFEASKAAGKIVSVREDGPAFKAGLRNGEPLISKSVSHDQPEKLARFKVLSSAGVQTIQFYPRGKNATVPQYHLDKDLEMRSSNACVAR